MSCPAYREPIRWRRKIIQIGLEDSYGSLASRLRTLPVYGQEEPLNPNYNPSERTQADQPADDIIPLNGSWDITLQSFVDGSGDPNQPAVWMDLLEACGMTRVIRPGATWYESGEARSVSIIAHTENVALTATGSRGSFSMSGSAGGSVPITFKIFGLDNLPFALRPAPPPIPVVPDPPRLVGAQVSITRQGQAPFVPIVKSFSYDSGAQPIPRFDGDESTTPSEFFLTEPIDPQWSLTVERDRGIDWVDVWRKEEMCMLTQRIGTQSGHSIRMSTLGYTAKLASAPASGQVDGIWVQNLTFRLLSNRPVKFSQE